MNAAMIETILELALSLLSKTITNADVDTILNALEAWLPFIIKVAPNLYAKVQTIIGLVQGSDVLTPEQVDRINAMNMDSDTAFDAALAQAQKEV